jgi:hypothetical protein
MRSKVHTFAALLMLVTACGSGTFRSYADGDDPAVLEYQVKAGFVFNFLKFVSWPTDAGIPTDVWRIGVIGDRSVVETMSETLAGGTIAGRPVEVSAIGEDADLARCHVVFVEDNYTDASASLVATIRDRPILVVGETRDFARTHGIIGFVRRKNNLRLEINPGRAKEAGLIISGKLASLADLVEEKS